VRLLSVRCPLSVFVAGGLLDIVEAGFAQQLLEYSPDALLLVGPDGAISFLNTAAERLFGYPRAQLLGADHSLLLAEASREEFHGVLAGLGNAASPGSPTAGSPSPGPQFAGSGRRADGTELPVEITCSLVPAPAGAVDAGTSVALSIRGAAGGNPGAGSGGRTLSGDFARRRAPGSAGTSLSGGPAAAAPAAFAEHDDELKAGSLRDPLTALPNGPLFNERLAAALTRWTSCC
jgi:PAS domain S-box-containing protein